ncbi:MAG: helix-turn-helix domain-containing protein [Bacteroidetes bacterium]|nr:helix-turn-helix domain-containing protein [Bacteroidota bacterium]
MASKKLKPAPSFTVAEKYNRNFSEQFKRDKVKDLVEKRISAKQMCDLWQISRKTVYKWLYKNSPHLSPAPKWSYKWRAKRTRPYCCSSRLPNWSAS